MIPLHSLEPTSTVPLQNMFLHVTKACNLQCAYCYFSANKPLPDEMTTEEFANLWPQIVVLRPKKVIFTGGEPLLRPDILDLLRALRDADPEHSVSRCLNSNGHLVTTAFARASVGLADEVRVSLDAMSERNDMLRGSGNFDAAVRALDIYGSLGFEPKVLITVTSLSLPDLEDLIGVLARRGIRRITINVFRPVGRGAGHRSWVVEGAPVREAVHRAWQRLYPDAPSPVDTSEPEHATNCGVGGYLNIMPNGDVFPCHVLTNPEYRCGNVRERGLLELCRRDSLIGALAALDFGVMAIREPRIQELTTSRSACMGKVYAETEALPIWKDHIPLIQIGPAPFAPL